MYQSILKCRSFHYWNGIVMVVNLWISNWSNKDMKTPISPLEKKSEMISLYSLDFAVIDNPP